MLRLLSSLFIASAKAEAASPLVSLPLATKGLIVVGAGLLGVFLVLFLFYLTIKLMQKIK